ncbi:MAG TPA: glycosyltransferase [Oligoflexia bacterium]|nr:glycosyltransferase [Oligoflexia bacterium]HMP48218.1 glycosyltransferase [Oligoflexia bacterium]
MAANKISLCMIARDEEDWLPQCLESVRSLVDEIILVDTGSRDKTVEIANKAGARVFNHEWVDDFSVVRNESLKHASGDWILVLDADEVIDQSDHDRIRELINNKRFSYLLTQRHYCDDERLSDFKPCRGEFPEWERNYKGYFESALVRLFPNNMGVNYQGRIHELAEHSIYNIKELAIADPGVRIHHFGHTPEVRARKTKGDLYTPLGKVKVQEKENDWKSYFELGVELNNNLEYADSAKAFEKALALAPWYCSTYVNYGYVLCQLARYDEAESILVLCINKFPEESEAFCNLGVVKLRCGKFADAIPIFRQAIRISPQYVNAMRNLALAYLQMGRLSEAVLVCRRILELMPGDKRTLLFLASVYKIGKMPNEAATIFASLYRDGSRELEIVTELYESIRLSRDAIDGIKFLQAHLGRVEQSGGENINSKNEVIIIKRLLDQASVNLFLDS